MESNLVKIIFVSLLCSFLSNAQAPEIEWQEIFGGTNQDYAKKIIQTQDGGYIVGGETYSLNGDIIGNHGGSDYWMIKISSTGTLEWQKTFGGSNYEHADDLIQTSDGGYIFLGSSSSNNGNVSLNYGYDDIWVVKLSVDGTIEWQKNYGGTDPDFGHTIKQTNDNGYIIAGTTYSNNIDVTENNGATDCWILKLNSLGVLEWQNNFGGTNQESARDIIQISDGSYLVTGSTNSSNGDVTGQHGAGDAWVLKLNSIGILEWQKTLGGTNSESLNKILQTEEGGYILIGNTNSHNGDVIPGSNGDRDFWVVKLSVDGTVEWQKTYGGIFEDVGLDIKIIENEGYLLAGHKYSNGLTGMNYWILKINFNGEIQWQKIIGENGYDFATSILKTNDNGYAVAGYSDSYNNDLFGNDFLIIKLSHNLNSSSFSNNTTLQLFPNPTRNNLTLKLDNYTPNQKIIITDIQGKTILTQKLESLSTTINTNSFEKGVYFLSLIDGTQKTTKKFIVE